MAMHAPLLYKTLALGRQGDVVDNPNTAATVLL
jgi:hypothetical protein